MIRPFAPAAQVSALDLRFSRIESLLVVSDQSVVAAHVCQLAFEAEIAADGVPTSADDVLYSINERGADAVVLTGLEPTWETWWIVDQLRADHPEVLILAAFEVESSHWVLDLEVDAVLPSALNWNDWAALRPSEFVR